MIIELGNGKSHPSRNTKAKTKTTGGSKWLATWNGKSLQLGMAQAISAVAATTRDEVRDGAHRTTSQKSTSLHVIGDIIILIKPKRARYNAVK
jgi:hypothetical protein